MIDKPEHVFIRKLIEWADFSAGQGMFGQPSPDVKLEPDVILCDYCDAIDDFDFSPSELAERLIAALSKGGE